MNYILYTTTKSSWYQDKADIVAERLSNTRGRGKTTITVVHHRAPRSPYVVEDRMGAYRLSWEWFFLNYPREDYDGVFLHFTPYYRKKWGIKGDSYIKNGVKKHKQINGSRNARNHEYPEFWLCTYKEDADGYENLSNFERLLYHELGHFDEDLDDLSGNLLPQDSVHNWDYNLKQIHNYHILVDYRGYIVKQKFKSLIKSVIDYVTTTLATFNNK